MFSNRDDNKNKEIKKKTEKKNDFYIRFITLDFCLPTSGSSGIWRDNRIANGNGLKPNMLIVRYLICDMSLQMSDEPFFLSFCPKNTSFCQNNS